MRSYQLIKNQEEASSSVADGDDILFGELIAEVGWISQAQLDETAQISEEVCVPLGRVMLMRGLLTESELVAAIEVQSLIRDCMITMKSGKRALRLIGWASLPLDHALAAIGIDVEELPKPRNRLGSLMLSARYITKENVEAGLTLSVATGLPLGKALVLKGVATVQQIDTVLWAQKLIRADKVTRASAIHAIREMTSVAMNSTACSTKVVELEFAELLVLTGIVDQAYVADALEVARVNNQTLGEIMVLFALISDEIRLAATTICQRIRTGQLTLHCGAKALNIMNRRGATLDEALTIAGTDSEGVAQPNLTTIDFLRQVDCIKDEDVQRIIDIALSDAQMFKKMILQTRLIDEETLRIATRLKFLVKQGGMSIDQARDVFNRCRASNSADPIEELSHCPSLLPHNLPRQKSC